MRGLLHVLVAADFTYHKFNNVRISVDASEIGSSSLSLSIILTVGCLVLITVIVHQTSSSTFCLIFKVTVFLVVKIF